MGPPGRLASFGDRASVDDGQHVAGGQDQVLLAVVLDLGAAVLGIDHDVTLRDVQRHAVALVIDPTGADSDDLALLGLLLGSVRDDEAGRCRRLSLTRLDNDLVFERLDVHAHRYDLHGSSKALAGTRIAVCSAPATPPSRVPGRYW